MSNRHMSIQGYEGSDLESPLGNADELLLDTTKDGEASSSIFGLGKKNKAKREANRAKRKASRKARREKRALRHAKNVQKRAERKAKGKGFFRGIWKGVKRFNPLSQTVRAGTVMAFRLNFKGMATRMYPAFLSDSEISKRKFNKANAKKAKAQWIKVSNFWEKKLGGKAKNLEKVIKKGYDKPIFRNKNKPHNFTGNPASLSFVDRHNGMFFEGMGWQYADAIFTEIEGKDGKLCMDKTRANLTDDDLVAMSLLMDEDEVKSGVLPAVGAGAVIVSAMPVIAQIIGMLTKGGVSKNPYDGGTDEGDDYIDDYNEGGLEDPSIDAQALAEIERQGAEDAGKGGEDLDDDIMGIPKMAVYIGGGVIGTGLLILLVRAVTGGSKK